MASRDDNSPEFSAKNLADITVTAVMDAPKPAPAHGPAAILVATANSEEPQRFTDTFRIGRGEDCDVRVNADGVSREHCVVSLTDGNWKVQDTQSTNGTWLDDIRVETAPIQNSNVLRLGRKGPVLWLTLEGHSDAAVSEVDLKPYLDRYVQGDETDGVGGHTRLVRRAVDVTRRRQHRRHLMILAAVVAVALVAVTTVWRWRAAQVEAARETAIDIFYSMKDLELQLAGLEEHLGENADALEQLESGRDRLGALESNYDRYLSELDLIGESTPERTRLVLRIARVFGECEIGMPPTLVSEIEHYIDRWRQGTRLEQAMARLREGGFAARAATAFDRMDLPAQYTYVALQESDFRLDACGPKTRYGIAKGAWQFIPATGRAYGLSIGPLYLERRFDPQDDRHDFDRASAAAASYLRDIYLREAQGSGLLALAIYNYGGSNVRRLIRSLPESPRERNFWQVLIEHRDQFPKETFDYVLNIFSAAVIGESPQLFGFDFPPPLEDALIHGPDGPSDREQTARDH